MDIETNKQEVEAFGALLASVNDSTRALRAIYVTFLVLMLYVALIAGGVNDEQLFLDGPVAVPFLSGLDLPVSAFFAVAPWLLLLLHVDLLVHFKLLADKLHHFNDATKSRPNQVIRHLRLRMADSAFNHWISGDGSALRQLTGFAVWTTLLAMPVAVLLVVQVKFLPYHSLPITVSHRIVLGADVGLLLFFWPAIRNPNTGTSSRSRLADWVEPLLWMGKRANVSLALLLLAVLFSCTVARLPGDRLEDDWWTTRLVFKGIWADWETHRFRRGWLHRNLYLPGFMGVQADTRTQEILRRGETDTEDWKTAVASVRGPDLRDRDLRHAYLDGAVLDRADLSGARLTHADMSQAHLNGANLKSAQLTGAHMYKAQLNGAEMVWAQLNGASLQYAQLNGADMSYATLSGANMVEAQLNGANMGGTKLNGANMGGTKLNGARLDRAQLNGADIGGAQLNGANMNGAQLNGAIMLWTKLNGAIMSGTKLNGANMLQARLNGATLKGAELNGAALDLASIGSAEFEGATLELNELVELDTTPLERSRARDIAQAADDSLAHLPTDKRKEIRERIEGRADQKTAGFAPKDCLSDIIEGCAGPEQMQEFYRRLTAYLGNLACDSETQAGLDQPYIAKAIGMRALVTVDRWKVHEKYVLEPWAELARRLLGGECRLPDDKETGDLRDALQKLADRQPAYDSIGAVTSTIIIRSRPGRERTDKRQGHD